MHIRREISISIEGVSMLNRVSMHSYILRLTVWQVVAKNKFYAL
jgi:hypothetical protein